MADSADCKNQGLLDENLNLCTEHDGKLDSEELEQLKQDVEAGIVNIRDVEVQKKLKKQFPEVCRVGTWPFEDKLRTVNNLVYGAQTLICATSKLHRLYQQEVDNLWCTCSDTSFNNLDGTWLDKTIFHRLQEEKDALKQHADIVDELLYNLTGLKMVWWFKIKQLFVNDCYHVRCYFYNNRASLITSCEMTLNLPSQIVGLYPLLCSFEQVLHKVTLFCSKLLKIASCNPIVISKVDDNKEKEEEEDVQLKGKVQNEESNQTKQVLNQKKTSDTKKSVIVTKAPQIKMTSETKKSVIVTKAPQIKMTSKTIVHGQGLSEKKMNLKKP